MPFRYKVNVLEKLKESGYTSYRIRKEGLLSDTIVKKLRAGDTDITLKTLEQICSLLKCSPTDIIEFKLPEE